MCAHLFRREPARGKKIPNEVFLLDMEGMHRSGEGAEVPAM